MDHDYNYDYGHHHHDHFYRSTETLSQREEKIRESWVRTMEARIVREELQKCHKAEGVNHYQACSDLAKKYHSLLADAKVSSNTDTFPSSFLLPFQLSHHLVLAADNVVLGILIAEPLPLILNLLVGWNMLQVKGFRVIDTA